MKAEKGKKIRIMLDGNKYEVKVVKVLEMLPNGNGFVKVRFANGIKKNLAIWKI